MPEFQCNQDVVVSTIEVITQSDSAKIWCRPTSGYVMGLKQIAYFSGSILTKTVSRSRCIVMIPCWINYNHFTQLHALASHCFHSHIIDVRDRATSTALAAFVDVIQKIADIATGAKGSFVVLQAVY